MKRIFKKRKYWVEYLKAHEDIINKCNTSWAPGILSHLISSGLGLLL